MVLAFCLGMQNTNNTDYLKTVTNHKHFVANNFESVVRQSKSCLKFYNWTCACAKQNYKIYVNC